MTLVHILDARAQAEPDRPAFTIADQHPTRIAHLTQGQIAERSAELAVHLAERGVGRGDRVAFVLGTCPELILGIVATQRLGATPAVLNPGLPFAAIERQVRLIRASMVIGVAEIEDLAGRRQVGEPAALCDVEASDLAFLQLTSGTSGESKAAAITHANLLASLEASRELLEVRPDDELVGWVPIHHDLGLVRFVLTPLYFGLHCRLLQPSVRSIGAWLRTIAETRATLTGAPDFAYRLAVRTVPPLDLSCLRVATNGGEPVRASTIAAFEAHFACPGAVRPGYGLAEATLGVCSMRPGEPLRIDANGHVGCGRPARGMEVAVTVDGAPAAVREVGDLQIRGEAVFAGYWTETGFDRETLRDGWHRTGDTGYVDSDGMVFVLGRTRAMIKRAGALIAPREAEEAADRAGLALGVRFSAAIGVAPGTTQQEALVLVCEVRPDASPAPLAQVLARAVHDAIGMPPSQIRLVPPGSIPLTANGKIRHAELKRLIESDAAPFSAPPPAASS
jgi:fatty-acyl-CoA synthase